MSREEHASHEGLDDAILYTLEPQGHEQARRTRWARLIQQDLRRRSPGLLE